MFRSGRSRDKAVRLSRWRSRSMSSMRPILRPRGGWPRGRRGDGPGAIGDLVMDVGGGHHRWWLRRRLILDASAILRLRAASCRRIVAFTRKLWRRIDEGVKYLDCSQNQGFFEFPHPKDTGITLG